MDIKEEDPLSDDAALQNETAIFTEDIAMKTSNDAVLLGDDCDMTIKTEIKSETVFPDFCSQEKRECFTKHKKQIKSETLTSSNNCETDMKKETEEQDLVLDFCSSNEREFLLEDPVMKVKKCNSDHEMDNKIEIKVEPWWPETEASSVCDDNKDEDLPLTKSSRLCKEVVSGDSHGKSPLPFAEVAGRETSFLIRNDHSECESQERDVTGIPNVEHVYSELSDKCRDGEAYSRVLYSKQKDLNPKEKRPHICKTCDKSFTWLSHLKLHNLIHEGKKPHECKICGKRFTQLSSLKRHNLIHAGKKPHWCRTCNKSFIELSNLKIHILIHEGKKPHQCKICDKRFTHLSHLKTHNLIHEGKKPHQCKTCNRTFTHLSSLKMHNLIHEDNKAHQCKICDKSFTHLSSFKRHNLIHEGKKPHQCKTCDKSFTHLSSLKRHNVIHEGKKP